MSRYPNLVADASLLAARPNGFFNRQWFDKPGAYAFTIPADCPIDNRGLVRVKGVVLGAGAGGAEQIGPLGISAGGTGGGYSHKTLWVPPGSLATIVVGAGGQQSSYANGNVNTAGGTTSITIAGVTWQATGGGVTVGGEGSGGDTNTTGGGREYNNLAGAVTGASAGSPWGNGRKGSASAAATGPKWLKTSFWDLDDVTDTTLLGIEVTGIGMGAGSDPASFGGGGRGGQGLMTNGAGGLAMLYW